MDKLKNVLTDTKSKKNQEINLDEIVSKSNDTIEVIVADTSQPKNNDNSSNQPIASTSKIDTSIEVCRSRTSSESSKTKNTAPIVMFKKGSPEITLIQMSSPMPIIASNVSVGPTNTTESHGSTSGTSAIRGNTDTNEEAPTISNDISETSSDEVWLDESACCCTCECWRSCCERINIVFFSELCLFLISATFLTLLTMIVLLAIYTNYGNKEIKTEGTLIES